MEVLYSQIVSKTLQGFLELRMPLWKRNLVTRSIAILPSLIVAILAGKRGSTMLIILASAILAFQLPFAIIPLMVDLFWILPLTRMKKFTSSPIKMGKFANSRVVKEYNCLSLSNYTGFHSRGNLGLGSLCRKCVHDIWPFLWWWRNCGWDSECCWQGVVDNSEYICWYCLDLPHSFWCSLVLRTSSC